MFTISFFFMPFFILRLRYQLYGLEGPFTCKFHSRKCLRQNFATIIPIAECFEHFSSVKNPQYQPIISMLGS